MKILLLGNGFDIDNGLPTKYKDFIKFTTVLQELEKEIKDENKKTIKEMILEKCKQNKISDLKEYYFDLFINMENRKNQILNLLNNNSWYYHFCCKIKNNELMGDRWLDFEEEIDRIINIL